jgi:hypothetical protein
MPASVTSSSRPFATSTLVLVVACGLLAADLGAQTLYGISGSGVISQMSGPPGGPCAYPNGPAAGGFGAAIPHPCATVGTFPVGPLGDIAIDRATDTAWATDGTIVTGYSLTTVTVTSSFTLAPGSVVPGPLTGFGGGLLWITDGVFVAGIVPPAFPGCGMLPGVVAPPWAVPAPMAPLSDIAFDPSSGTLWGCSSVGGIVSNLLVGGGVGPGGVFPGTASCALVPALTGIAVDTTRPGFLGLPTTLYVTDGTTIAAIAPGGPVAPPSFHAPLPCWSATGVPAAGLAFSLHGVTYGTGTDPGGASIPLTYTFGQSTSPSATFGIGLLGADAAPGTAAALFVAFAPLCPSLTGLGGNSIYAAPTLLLGPFPVVGGAISLPVALPAAPFIGATVYAQWIVAKGGAPGAFEAGAGMAFTLGLQ